MKENFCSQDFMVPGRDPQSILLRLYRSLFTLAILAY